MISIITIVDYTVTQKLGNLGYCEIVLKPPLHVYIAFLEKNHYTMIVLIIVQFKHHNIKEQK